MDQKKPIKFNFEKKEWKEKKGWEPHHYHINYLLILCIILVIILAVLLKSAFLGYKFSQQFKELGLSPADYLKQLDETKTKLAVEKTNTGACEESKKNVLNDLSNEKKSLAECKDDAQALNTKFEGLKNEYNYNLTRIRDSLELEKDNVARETDDQKLEYASLERNFDNLAANAANNLCCKAKVDDKKIDSYVIVNNGVVCTSGEDKKVSC